MNKKRARSPRLLWLAVFLVMSLAIGDSAQAAVRTPRASLFVTNPGPLPACVTPDSCAKVGIYIYIQNPNTPTLAGQRDHAVGAFVVSSIDVTMTINGSVAPACGPSTFTLTPPPTGLRACSRFSAPRWPSTVYCPPAPADCNVVGKPAVLPREKTVIMWVNWGHGIGEAVGSYVFAFTIHGVINDGSANGLPMDLTVQTAPILMQ